MKPTDASVHLRLLLMAAERVGVESKSLLEDAGIAYDDVFGDPRPIPFDKARKVYGQLPKLTSDPLIALHAGASSDLKAGMGLWGLRILASKNVGEATALCMDNLKRLSTAVVQRAGEDAQGGWIRQEAMKPIEGDKEVQTLLEFLTSFWVTCMRSYASPGWAPKEVRFRFDVAPEHRAAYADFFRAPLQFGADIPGTEMRFSADVWQQPLMTEDPLAKDTLDQYFEREKERAPLLQTLAGRVGSLLRSQKVGRLALQEVAKQLGYSSRALQEDLRGEGQSFRSLSEKILQGRALTLLQKGRSASDVGTELGFSDRSSFHRAFLRWTGQTPSQFAETCGNRHQLQCEPLVETDLA